MKREFQISFSSTVPEIEDLTFYGIPTQRIVEFQRVIRQPNLTVWEGSDKKLYSASVRCRGHYGFGRGSTDDYIRAAHKLGRITKAQADKHFKDADDFEAKKKRCELANTFIHQAAKLGIELSQKQLRALKKHKE